MTDYEYYYNQAKSKYYNACSQVTACENKLSDLKTKRQAKVTQINELKASVRSHQAGFDRMASIVKAEAGLDAKLTRVVSRTERAGAVFSGMVDSSAVVTKSLSDVYGGEASATKRVLARVVENLRAKKDALGVKIADLQARVRRAQSELSDIDAATQSTKSSLAEWKRVRKNASYDMEYYRRKMREAV